MSPSATDQQIITDYQLLINSSLSLMIDCSAVVKSSLLTVDNKSSSITIISCILLCDKYDLNLNETAKILENNAVDSFLTALRLQIENGAQLIFTPSLIRETGSNILKTFRE